MMNKATAFLLTLGLASTPALADPIVGLFNTGVNGAGATKANNTPEIHYSLFSAPAGSSPSLRVATSANGFPLPPWIGDNLSSAWIGPDGNADLSGPAGTYDYRISFALPATANPATVLITGQWATDNPGTDILINGGPSGSSSGSFTSFAPFVLNANFHAGVNTLDFLVNNTPIAGPNPTGLRVEFASATVDVPEPSAIALSGLALSVLGMVRRRRRRT